MNATEFFIEIRPGQKLESMIAATKKELIELLGDSIVDDPTQIRFLRDNPHFTLQVARVHNLDDVVAAYRKVAGRWRQIVYKVDGVNRVHKGGLWEVHATIAPSDQRYFRDLHYAIVEASVPFLTKDTPRMFPSQNFNGYELENLEYCHFPMGRGNYIPHVSVGRFAEDVLAHQYVDTILAEFKPEGDYDTDLNLVVWEYIPDDPTFATKPPIMIPLLG